MNKMLTIWFKLLLKSWPTWLMAVVGSVSFSPSSYSQQIWFAPLAPFRSVKGVLDWSSLFEPSAQWPFQNVQVFQFPTGYLDDTPGDQLQAQARFLQSHSIAFAVVIQSVVKTDSCAGPGEGFDVKDEHSKIAHKLSALGIKVNYLIMDGPVWFGSFDQDRGSCHYDAADLARQVSLSVNEYVKLFPDLLLGDTEGVPALTAVRNWEAFYTDWKKALSAKTGKQVSSLRFDVNWGAPSWPNSMGQAFLYAKSQGMNVGVIYNSGRDDDNDRDWVAHAAENITDVESLHHLRPDFAVFQSWESHPVQAGPDTSSDSLSHLIRQYLLPRESIVIDHEDSQFLSGHVVVALPNATAIPSSPIYEVSLGHSPGEPAPIKQIRGTVPTNAFSAIVALRVNMECGNCEAKNDFEIGDSDYHETTGGSHERRIPIAKSILSQRHYPPGVSITADGDGSNRLAHIVTSSRATYFYNSRPFRVTAGAQFNLKIPAATSGPGGLSGYAALIWLDQTGRGFARSRLLVPPTRKVRARTMTGEDGRFVLRRWLDERNPVVETQLMTPWSGSARAAIEIVPPS